MISLLAAAAFLFQPLAVERRYEAEAQDLAADPKVAAAMTALDGMGEASLEDLVAITETPAPPFGEGPRAKLVAVLVADSSKSARSCCGRSTNRCWSSSPLVGVRRRLVAEC